MLEMTGQREPPVGSFIKNLQKTRDTFNTPDNFWERSHKQIVTCAKGFVNK